jgi:DNA-binding response OmpR family regulator
MSPHQLLFLTSDCDAAALWLAGLDQFDRTYSITVASQSDASSTPETHFDLILVEAEADTMAETLDTCRHLCSTTSAPLLVLSSLDNEDYALETYKAGIDEYIVKPLGFALLHAKLQAWQRWIVPATEPAASHNMQTSKRFN